MPERALIYCGTPPVDARNTLALLEGPAHAIWYPPRARRLHPAAGDKVWLLWKDGNESAALLGGGRLKATSDGKILWTNRTAPGVRELAQEVGYRGPTNMSFLVLEEVRVASAGQILPTLRSAPAGLSEATDEQRELLEETLPL